LEQARQALEEKAAAPLAARGRTFGVLADGDRLVLAAVNGYGQAADRRRTLEAGFDQHLVKPVDPQHLNDVLALATRRSTSTA